LRETAIWPWPPWCPPVLPPCRAPGPCCFSFSPSPVVRWALGFPGSSFGNSSTHNLMGNPSGRLAAVRLSWAPNTQGPWPRDTRCKSASRLGATSVTSALHRASVARAGAHRQSLLPWPLVSPQPREPSLLPARPKRVGPPRIPRPLLGPAGKRLTFFRVQGKKGPESIAGVDFLDARNWDVNHSDSYPTWWMPGQPPGEPTPNRWGRLLRPDSSPNCDTQFLPLPMLVVQRLRAGSRWVFPRPAPNPDPPETPPRVPPLAGADLVPTPDRLFIARSLKATRTGRQKTRCLRQTARP